MTGARSIDMEDVLEKIEAVETEPKAPDLALEKPVKEDPKKAAQQSRESFLAILKDPSMQAEFDKLTAKSIETAIKKEREATKREQTAAERLSQLSSEERLQKEREELETERQKLQAEKDAHNADMLKRELRYQAVSTLAQRELPTELADLLDYADADACAASIEKLDKAVKGYTDKALAQRMKQGAPKANHTSGDNFKASLQKAMGIKK
jgi:hypothetical protein